MQAQYTTIESDSRSMGDDDDIIFLRSVEKPRAPKGNGSQAKKRANPSNVSALAVSPSPAAKKRLVGNQATKRTKPSNFFAKVGSPSPVARKRVGGDEATMRAEPSDVSVWAVAPSPATRAQVGGIEVQPTASDVNYADLPPEKQDSFMLATRKALESALGKEALDRQEEFLAEEQKRTDRYIAQLEEVVKLQGVGDVSLNVIAENQIAMLKAKAEAQDATARTEINILRENNRKLTEHRTLLLRSVKLLQEQQGAVKSKSQDDARAEIQILHEINTKLIEEKATLSRSVEQLKDENRTLEAKGRDNEAARVENKTLCEHNTKLTEENKALLRKIEQLKDEHGNLRAEISALTQDVREQKRLGAFKKKQGSDKDVEAAGAEIKKLRKEIKKGKRRESNLAKEKTSLSEELAKLETERHATLAHQQSANQSAAEASDARERIEKFQQKIVKLNQGYHERGEQLKELSQDMASKNNI